MGTPYIAEMGIHENHHGESFLMGTLMEIRNILVGTNQVWGISENRDRKLSLECVTMNSPCKGKSLQTTVYWVDQ